MLDVSLVCLLIGGVVGSTVMAVGGAVVACSLVAQRAKELEG
jgi:hypothetical protein